MSDLEQSALAVYFANCQGIKSDPLPMLRKILALGEGDRKDAARYRHLRDSSSGVLCFLLDERREPEEWDAEIDEEMAALRGEGSP